MKKILKNIVSNFSFNRILIFGFIFIVGIISLPQITLNFSGQLITLPSLESITNQVIPNFRKGRDLYPTSEIKMNINFNEANLTDEQKRDNLIKSLNAIKDRIRLSNLNEIKVRSEILNSNYSIILSFPDFYADKNIIATFLAKKGEIKFVNSVDGSDVFLYDTQVNPNIQIVYLPQIKSHLRLTFGSDRFTAIANGLGEKKFFFMQIDGSYDYQMFQYDNSDLTSFAIRGVPSSQYIQNNTVLRDQILAITRSYFNQQPLGYTLDVEEEIKEVVPLHASTQSSAIIAISIFIFGVLVCIYSILKYRLRKGIGVVLMILSYALLSTALLKLTYSSISVYFIFSWLLLFIFISSLVWYLVTDLIDKRIFNRRINKINYVGLGLILVSIISLNFALAIQGFREVIQVFLIGGISLIVLSLTIFKLIYKEFFEENE